MAEDLAEMKLKLKDWIRQKMPHAKGLALSDLEKPGMGLSSETLLFDMSWEENGQKISKGVVLRAAPFEGKGVFPEYELGHQFHIMRILGETDIPVATMLWLEEDPDVIGAPFFLMEKLEGDVPQDYPSYHGSGMYFEATPEQRSRMWWGTLDAIVKIHKLDWKEMGFSFLGVPESNADSVDRQLAYWDDYLNKWIKDEPEEPHPTMDAALEWLKQNRYEPERLVLCWGDARIGNTLYSRPDRDVLAVMDWEMAFIGDPECDLAWFITLDKQHSKGYGLPRLPGTPEDEEVIKRYEELSGWAMKNLFFNEVLATFRYGLTTIAVMKGFQKQGIPFEDELILNNFATQHLSDLLGLPSPGAKKQEVSDINQITVSVQFHFTGPGGGDWYLISDKGKATRYDGTIENPNCTIKVSVDDWKAIQSGELNQLDAWSTGRLLTEGDLGLLALLKDTMAEFTQS
jgi:aminoglycoside phosphotransferase (APT) family kinase protein/putative sterol carrier protein